MHLLHLPKGVDGRNDRAKERHSEPCLRALAQGRQDLEGIAPFAPAQGLSEMINN